MNIRIRRFVSSELRQPATRLVAGQPRVLASTARVEGSISHILLGN
jgi:hypothetical protein